MDIFLFVLSYVIQLIASSLLVYRIWSVRSVNGLSLDTQICFLLSGISRVIWTMNTRIVESNALFAVLAVLELISSVSTTAVIVHLFRKFRHTTTQTVPAAMSAYVLIPLAMLVAFLVNPGKYFSFTAQTLVAYTMYVEALALVPQLWIVRKLADVETLTSHYIGLLVISRFVRMLFWLYMFSDGQWFLCLCIADLFHTILSADYFYLWVKKLRHGGRLVYSL
jgi:ER lumen protein retaining receptor